MPEITVTETQRERLATIQSDIEAAYIDSYGHIRTTDVVQYLLDTYTPPEDRGANVDQERTATAGFKQLQAVAADVSGVPGSGIDTETMRGELLSALGVEEFAARLAEVDDGEGIDADAEDGDAERGVEDDAVSGADAESGADVEAESSAENEAATDSDGSSSDEEAETATAEDTDADGDTGADASDGTGSGPGATPNTDGPGAILSAANQLLTDHEDKWRKGGSDEPYEVDLPDGTTETVRTKDDVRGLLFKHY